MALIEFEILKVDYIFFLLLVIMEFIIIEDSAHIYFSLNKIPSGISNIVNSLASLSIGMIYFISEGINLKKKVIKPNNPKSIKQILLELSPGFISATFILLQLPIYVVIPHSELSFLSKFLEFCFQLASLIFGIHFWNVFIFKLKTYIHHKLALGIIFSTVIIFFIIFNSKTRPFLNLNPYNILNYVLYIVSNCLMSLKFVVQKYLIQKKFCNMYYTELMTGIGFFSLVLPFVFFNNYNKLLKEFFVMQLGYLELIEFFVDYVLWEFFYIKVLTALDPMYLGLECLILMILSLHNWSPARIICTFIILINCLVYTESVIINAWGLSYYCKVNIRIRGESELGQLIEDKKKTNKNKDDCHILKKEDLVDIDDVTSSSSEIN